MQLVGSDAIGEPERAILVAGRLLREAFLQQSAFGDDAYAPLSKQSMQLRAILRYYDTLDALVRDGYGLEACLEASADIRLRLERLREQPAGEMEDQLGGLLQEIEAWVTTTRASQAPTERW